MHAALTNTEPATALPTEDEFLAATVTLLNGFTASAPFSIVMGLFSHWTMDSSFRVCLWRLVVYTYPWYYRGLTAFVPGKTIRI